jgi:hypothetical protein
MRNLKRSVPPTEENVTVHRGDAHVPSESFKKALQVLEKVILQKLLEKPISSGNLLAVLLDEQSALLERLTPEWQRQELARVIRRIQRDLNRQEAMDSQYLLPGFERLPKRISMGDKRQHLSSATHPELSRYLEVLERKQQESPRLIQLRAMVKLMWKYARQEPAITVREVCERERE